MAGGYQTPPGDAIEQLITRISELQRRVRELEMPTGSERAAALATLQELVDGLLTATNGVFAGYVSAGTSITAGTTISAGGDISTPGIVTGTAGLNSPDVYTHLVTYGSYRATWTNVDGTVGYAPSSARFKRDIETAVLPAVREIMRRFRITQHRYIAAVEANGEAAGVEWGPIAEEVHELGLSWLVDYDEDGLPFGVKHERIASLLVLDSQDKQNQIDHIEDRLRTIEEATNE